MGDMYGSYLLPSVPLSLNPLQAIARPRVVLILTARDPINSNNNRGSSRHTKQDKLWWEESEVTGSRIREGDSQRDGYSHLDKLAEHQETRAQCHCSTAPDSEQATSSVGKLFLFQLVVRSV